MTDQQDTSAGTFVLGLDRGLPELADLVGNGRLAVQSSRVATTYLDTEDGGLQQAGLRLRRRAAGSDVGWRLELPAGSPRGELDSRARSRAVPRALAEVVLGITRGRPLAPVVELTTERTVTRLSGADDCLRAELTDDRVRSISLGAAVRLDQWREVALSAGEEPLLAVLRSRLLAAGAVASEPTSPLARARDRAPALDTRPREPVTLADLVLRYLRAQCEDIVAGDLALRLGEPQVHRTRVAIRRMRSTLRVFGTLFATEPAERLDAELSWFAGLLGEVRDREVLLDRLQQQVAALPPELVLGPVAAELDTMLSGEAAQHLRTVGTHLGTARHLELLEAVARWRAEPPYLEAADAPAKQVRTHVDAARATMRRRLKQALRAAEDTDERLHRARKAAKRARYAAELAEPVWPRAAATVLEAKQLQTTLGEHQDSAVSAAFLRRAGAAAGARAGHNGFTYGVLAAAEWQRAADIRAAFLAQG